MIKRVAAFVVASSMVLMGLPASEAAAQPTAARAVRARTPAQLAQRDFERGLRAMRARDYKSALEAFSQAYERTASVDILWNIAVAELKSGDALHALAHFREYMANPKARPERLKQAAAEMIPVAYARTGHVRLASWDKLENVKLDGADIAGFDREIDVNAGHHEIDCKFADGGMVHTAVDAASGVLVTVAVESPVEEEPAAPEAAAPPPPPAQPAPRATAPSTVTQHTTVQGRGWAVLGLTALSVAAAGAGGYFLVRAHSEHEDALARVQATDASPCLFPTSSRCRATVDAVQSDAHDRSLARGMFVASGTLAVAAVITWLVWPKAATSTTVHASADGWSIEATRRF